MISHLSIQNFAIIKDLSVDFEKGLQIVTGETGAGKSIIIEAINLALGSRADTSYVRTGADRASIRLVIDVDTPSQVDFLKSNDIEETSQLFIARDIYASGKSVCKLNNEMVSVSFLSKLCGKLADIHGQYDHQSLLNPERHIDLVDAYCAALITGPKEQMSAAYDAYERTRRELSSLRSQSDEKQRQLDFLSYELDEIRAANLQPGEDDELENRLTLLQNSEKILGGIACAYELLTGESSDQGNPLAKALHELEDIASYDTPLQEFTASLSDCYYKLEDIASDMRRYRDGISFSQDEIDETIARLDMIGKLKRKHGGSLQSVLAYAKKAEEDIAAYQNSETRLDDLSAALPQLEQSLTAFSQEVSQIRRQAAAQMEQKIQAELSELNFANASLKIAFHAGDGDEKQPRFTENGIDVIEFMIATNKGEPYKPLSKIASGGEISRIMLAFKRIIADYDDMSTMIFDEIDTGISGSTASIVGRKMLGIANGKQVICITHLPQVAAFGDENYKIVKETKGDETFTGIIRLSADEKTAEIARMLGGIQITESALQNARDLINQSNPIQKTFI